MPPIGTAPNLSSIKYGKPITLCNSKNMKGWRPIDPNRPNGFKVVNGILQNDPVRPENGDHIYYRNLRTVQEFGDFNLTLKVNVPAGNNSGAYLRGLYEIQVVDSYGSEVDSQNMGALYSRISPIETVEKPGGERQALDISLVERHVPVILNGTTIIDYQPVHGPTGGALSSNVLAAGPYYYKATTVR